jgi:hypothetical protein
VTATPTPEHLAFAQKVVEAIEEMGYEIVPKGTREELRRLKATVRVLGMLRGIIPPENF